MLCRRLLTFDCRVIAYDPYIDADTAAELGVELVSLEEAFACADVVSLHTPLLDETVGLITGKLLASMKRGATLINTARGELVNEPEMIEVLKARPDLFAALDVTATEPPLADSMLYVLPNVALTPHIAGCTGADCRRLGRCMIEETRRFLNGENLRWQITRDKLAILA
jgi:phosphoglycerate dehydrogenase-like enzyme